MRKNGAPPLNGSAIIGILLLLFSSCLAQTSPNEESLVVMRGYLFQNQVTPESYLLTDAKQLKEFVEMLPPTIPYKVLPAPPNTDPFRNGFPVDFRRSVVAVAVRRNGITDWPSYLGTKERSDGVRTVHFLLAAPTAESYPLGWAVYSAVVLPRTAPTAVVVTTAPAKKRNDHKFPRLGE